jgi:hypothetical protein
MSKLNGWAVCGVVVLSFAAGCLCTAYLTHVQAVRADSSRVFELEIYHAVAGKVPALAERFRSASQLQAKHDLNVVGYWIPEGSPAFANTFIYLVAHASEEEAKKNWDSFHADPAFQEYVKSEQTVKLIEGVDRTFMRPTDYSALK